MGNDDYLLVPIRKRSTNQLLKEDFTFPRSILTRSSKEHRDTNSFLKPQIHKRKRSPSPCWKRSQNQETRAYIQDSEYENHPNAHSHYQDFNKKYNDFPKSI